MFAPCQRRTMIKRSHKWPLGSQIDEDTTSQQQQDTAAGKDNIESHQQHDRNTAATSQQQQNTATGKDNSWSQQQLKDEDTTSQQQ